jgi:hypothetical protein
LLLQLLSVSLVYCSQYLAELLAEHQKLGPFMQVLPICNKLLSQGEIFQFPPHCVLQPDGSFLQFRLSNSSTIMNWKLVVPNAWKSVQFR